MYPHIHSYVYWMFISLVLDVVQNFVWTSVVMKFDIYLKYDNLSLKFDSVYNKNLSHIQQWNSHYSFIFVHFSYLCNWTIVRMIKLFISYDSIIPNHTKWWHKQKLCRNMQKYEWTMTISMLNKLHSAGKSLANIFWIVIRAYLRIVLSFGFNH